MFDGNREPWGEQLAAGLSFPRCLHTMTGLVEVLLLLAIWVALNRWILPRFGVTT